ncbi:MAG: NAD-binding protein, partial [Flavobacteriales bacterium]
MKIIIAGAGEVGFHLAKLLSFESQDITLIDTNRDSLAYANSHLDIRVVRGDATSISILRDSKIQGTDLVVAVTSSETTNITVCVLAKQLGAKRTIARISNTEFIEKKDEVGFTKIGIDELISPESLAASEIELLLTKSAFNDTYQFEGGALTMIGLVLSRTASFVGKTVSDLGKAFPNLECVPVAIQRFGTQYTVIPRGDTQFKDGDQVYFITTPHGVDEIYKLT